MIIFPKFNQKQFEMSKLYPPDKYPFIRFFLGDIRDKKSHHCPATENVETIIHAAALKQVKQKIEEN